MKQSIRMDGSMTTAEATLFDRLALLSDTTRGRLLLALEDQELTVSELTTVLQLPQSTVSRHLKVLGDDGWVASRRDGTSRLYRATLDRLPDSAQDLWRLAREEVAAMPSARGDAERLAAVLAERRARSVGASRPPFKVRDLSLAELGPQGDPTGRARDARPDGLRARNTAPASRWPARASWARCT
jgi:DNA-binding transcriptional ArsR family regulator